MWGTFGVSAHVAMPVAWSGEGPAAARRASSPVGSGHGRPAVDRGRRRPATGGSRPAGPDGDPAVAGQHGVEHRPVERQSQALRASQGDGDLRDRGGLDDERVDVAVVPEPPQPLQAMQQVVLGARTRRSPTGDRRGPAMRETTRRSWQAKSVSLQPPAVSDVIACLVAARAGLLTLDAAITCTVTARFPPASRWRSALAEQPVAASRR
jgi:hypothetical protein